MLEISIILLFTFGLLGCLALNLSIIYALLFGYCLFFGYGILKKHRPRKLLLMSLRGIISVRNILILFVMIGCMTALWRSAGTIPTIIALSSNLFTPSIFLLLCFLLNCLMSVLTGSSFGTSATMGVICMSVANVMQLNPVLTGGAILSGAFFGDRCSPVSTSALLVAELTETSIYDNIHRMIKHIGGPLFLTCIIYLILGFFGHGTAATLDIHAIFAAEYALSLITLLPAILILILSIFRINVKKSMFLSIAAAGIISLWLQHMPMAALLHTLIFGYHAPTDELAVLLDGGGILSMVKVSFIVCLSSSFSGLFKATGMLDNIEKGVEHLSKRSTPFIGVLVTAIVTCAISCNQSLATLLTHQLCNGIENDKETLAMDLENTVIVIAPLIPWSIAGAVPLATIGAPTASLLAACYLYLVPLWGLIKSMGRKPNTRLM